MRSTPYHAELSTLAEVSQADCIITIGADLSRDHQVAGFMVKRQLPAGTKLIMLADPKNAFAANADLVLDTSKALVPAVKELIQGISDETSSVYRLVKNAGSIGFILGELPNEAEIDAFGKSFNELLDALQKSGKSSRVIHLNGGANGSSVSAFGLDGSVDVKDAKTVLLFQGEETIDQKLAQQLAAIPNLFVIGTYSSALSARAKVVLPVRAWWETAGNYVNIECTVQQSTPVTQAADGVSSMQEILAALGKLQGLDLKIEWQNTLGIPSRP
jgi:NADH dehydrogenase/NADH:ubiquinone oxidoreductase subunit G